MRNWLRLLLLLFVGTAVFAQEKAPLIKGKVKISIAEGTFDCDLTLSEFPPLKDYYIRLNSGMNILHFRSKKPNDFVLGFDKSTADSTSTGESIAYYFPDNSRKSKFLPEEIQLRYVGKFPVATDTIENYTREDWKGNIAFNGKSVRTDGFQTCWYPVLYDVAEDRLYSEVRYDIEIECADCQTLYINGNKPVKSQKTVFQSEVPREMTLFCGNFDFTNNNDTYILNPDLSEEQITEFCALTNSYKAFLSDRLRLPYNQPVTFVETTPTSKKNGWLFVSYPTIFSIGWGENGLQSLFNPKIQNWYRPFIAHELGHYYFGTYKVFNSELGDMMSEGFSEFLSLKVTQNLIGPDVYNKKLADKMESLKDFKPIPFSKVKSRSDYKDRELYVYYFAPLVFTAIELEIGHELMWKWLNQLLKAKTRFTDYDFLLETFKKTINNQKAFNALRDMYFDNDAALENALKRIGQR
ncbi:hypothetical protein [Flavobacterium silvaticum]|uniref:Peptidase M1 membrane alanine aminopeptidase domain-containing protein n=1 Tax=Flavobacterium silvaticum TaxID=1852020 RepID=A0A972JG68_9FLAO|nr:hypothetical protein [Flavobacterium silvaticum]NMH27881.1 hypothetical protein [Flavobacterium silvaticum]